MRPRPTDSTLPADALGAALAKTVAAFESGGAGDAPRHSALPTGDVRYSRGGEIGRGGMGTVYVAEDAQFGRAVALKELSQAAASAEGARRFHLEALVTANLEHPGIPPVYERGVRDGRPFYAMRKIDGRTLADAVRLARSYEERLALLPAVVRVAHTLGFAHERGVVHRDVKPDNVVLGEHGETVLLDWGIARVRGAGVGTSDDGAPPPELAAGATVAGAVMGTPAYMAPEQAAGRLESIDERTDVFALGAMLYHVLGGVPPYDGPTAVAVVTQAVACDRVPLRRLAPKVPEELHAVIDTAMAKESAARFPNAAAFADALEGFLTESVTRRPSRLVQALASAAGLILLLATVLAAVAISAIIPSFAEQGAASYSYVALTAVGCVLGLLEWRTKGRYHLGPLVLALAGITVVSGVAGTMTGLGIAARAMADLPPEQQTATWWVALWEVSGSIPLSANLACVQLVIWAIARRATLRAAQ